MMRISSTILLVGLSAALAGLAGLAGIALIMAKLLAFLALFLVFVPLGIEVGRRIDVEVTP